MSNGKNFLEFSRRFAQLTWHEQTIPNQLKLIQDFIQLKSSLPIVEVAKLETDFQRLLAISRDEWFRLLISKETEQLKSLKLIWEKKQSAKQAIIVGPPQSGIYPTGGWLGEFVYDYGRVIESPDSFLFWSAACAISATIRRHVFVRFGTRNIYPNLYVILVSKAGAARKGAPIKAAEAFAKSIVDINFIDRTSTERLPHDLSKKRVIIGGQPQTVPCDADGFLCAEELVAFLDDQSYNSGVLKFLIEWWDCPERKGIRTLKHGIIELKNLYIVVLGGTTPAWLEGALNNLVAGGGMLSRTLFIVEDRTPKMISWPQIDDENVKQRLIQQLATIESVNGEFKVADEALKWTDTWYIKFRKYLESNEQEAPAMERKQVHMIKLAMIIALSEGLPLEITSDLLQRADVILTEQERGLPEITRALLATPMGREHLRILTHIQKAGGRIYHSDLLRKNSPYGMDREALDRIVKTLEDSGQIKIDFDKAKPRNPKYYEIRSMQQP